MTIFVESPGAGALELDHLLLDINGTLTRDGQLLDGVTEAITALAGAVSVRLLSADTFGTARAVAERLGAGLDIVANGDEKLVVVERLDPGRCVAIGNGRNDIAMLRAVALGIAVIGPEGLSAPALSAADVVCTSIGDALLLLSEPARLTATLRP